MKHPDYSIITEVPGLQATQEQLERIYHRYNFAKDFCINKTVLEVACGSGMGLGFLALFSKKVSGVDIDKKNIEIAKQLYRNVNEIEIYEMDAHNLKFENNSFDVVLLYEAIYYLSNPDLFISEAKRVLKDDGTLIICTVNKEWNDFHPSPFVNKYFPAKELTRLASFQFDDVKIFGAFKVKKGFKYSVVSFIKKMAVKLNLIPDSLSLRAYFKRFFIGKTKSMPNFVSPDMTGYQAPVELDANSAQPDYKIIYAVCSKKKSNY